MPSHLKRYQQSGQSHFLTFSCFHRQQLFAEPAPKEVFVSAREMVRIAFWVEVYGYVVMPDHIHLLLAEPRCKLVSDLMKSVRLSVARQLIRGAEHFWQKRYYDFNVRDEQQFREKLRYLHRNPVARGLCELPEDWEWSSFRHYATGVEGPVEIESEWTARRRERVMDKQK